MFIWASPRPTRYAAHAVVLDAAGVDRRDRGPVGMPEQQAATKAYLVEQIRQYFERFDLHVVQPARQRHRRGGAIGCGTDHAVFEIGSADPEEAGSGDGDHVARSVVVRRLRGMTSLFPPPLRRRVSEGGEPQAPEFVVSPSPPFPRKGGERRACFLATIRVSIDERIIERFPLALSFRTDRKAN